jgi:hypothetical protein
MKRVLSILLTVLFVAAYGTVMAAPGGGGISQVTVVNQPTVNIGNQPTVNINGIPTVKVVQDIEPFQKVFWCDMNDGEKECKDYYTVPEGKRLVIEYFSCESDMYSGQNLSCSVHTAVGDNFIGHHLPTTPVVTAESGQRSHIVAGQLIKAYADPASGITFYGLRNGSVGSCGVVFNFSGDLVDVQ